MFTFCVIPCKRERERDHLHKTYTVLPISEWIKPSERLFLQQCWKQLGWIRFLSFEIQRFLFLLKSQATCPFAFSWLEFKWIRSQPCKGISLRILLAPSGGRWILVLHLHEHHGPYSVLGQNADMLKIKCLFMHLACRNKPCESASLSVLCTAPSCSRCFVCFDAAATINNEESTLKTNRCIVAQAFPRNSSDNIGYSSQKCHIELSVLVLFSPMHVYSEVALIDVNGVCFQDGVFHGVFSLKSQGWAISPMAVVLLCTFSWDYASLNSMGLASKQTLWSYPDLHPSKSIQISGFRKL